MRLDRYLVENALAKSRARAVELIKDGRVKCGGETVSKPSFEVEDGCEVTVEGEAFNYVGRGALKLICALDTFGVSPDGASCVDVGASTGGFTEVLLRRGAARVFAVDSGHGQLDRRLKDDQRVVDMEGFNAKELCAEALGGAVDIAVCDVSFISQTLLHAPIRSALKDGGTFIALVKPQFELTRGDLSKGGVVKDARRRLAAAKRVYLSLVGYGFSVAGFCASPITGGDGNIEYLICAEASSNASAVALEDIERTVLNEGRNTPEKGQ